MGQKIGMLKPKSTFLFNFKMTIYFVYIFHFDPKLSILPFYNREKKQFTFNLATQGCNQKAKKFGDQNKKKITIKCEMSCKHWAPSPFSISYNSCFLFVK